MPVKWRAAGIYQPLYLSSSGGRVVSETRGASSRRTVTDGGTRREHGNAITVHSFFELEPRVVLPEKKVNSGSEPFAASGTSEALGVVNSEASAPDETLVSARKGCGVVEDERFRDTSWDASELLP